MLEPGGGPLERERADSEVELVLELSALVVVVDAVVADDRREHAKPGVGGVDAERADAVQ